MNSINIFINSVLCVLILASGNAFAGRPDFGQQSDQNSKRPAGSIYRQGFMQEDPDFDRARLALRLKLTEEQREEIKLIHEASRELTLPIIDQLVLNRKEITDLIKVDAYDETSVQDLATTQGELISQLVILRANTKASVFSLLSDEQKAIIEKERPTNFGS